jgi:hypothetical protein
METHPSVTDLSDLAAMMGDKPRTPSPAPLPSPLKP